MIATHKIETIRFNQAFIILHIDGNELTIPLDKLSGKLKSATDVERERCTKFHLQVMEYIGL